MKLWHLLRLPWQLLRDTTVSFWEESMWRKAASVAFYALFATGPLLVIVLHLVGFLTGNEAGHDIMMSWLTMAVGERGTESVEDLIQSFSLPKSGWLSYGIGLYMLVFGGINAVGQLRETINSIWNTEEGDGEGRRPSFMSALVDLASVGAFTVLLVASLGLSSVLQYAGGAFDNEIPFGYLVVRIAGVLLSVVLLVVSLGAAYRYLPARRLSWAAISAGGLVAAALFGMGRFVMVAWLASAEFESVYGSIAFMIVFLLWVYFSAQVILYGAAFAAVTDRHRENTGSS